MMDMLADYVKSLAMFMIFASVCQIILPEGKLKGAVSFIIGIMLMLIVLKPVNAVINTEGKSIIRNSIKLNSYDTKNQLEQYGDGSEIVISAFKTSCENMLMEEIKAEAVNVKVVNDEEEGVYISSVELKIKNQDTEKIKSEVANLCGIEKDKIKVINEG